MRYQGQGLGASLRRCLLGALTGLGLAAGCGLPVPDSQYVLVGDATELAVDVWLPHEMPGDGTVPTVVRLGRYWRDYQMPPLLSPLLGKYPRQVSWLNVAGYAVVMVDVRGTGASFGVSTAPWSEEERGDYPLLIDWVVGQPWSDGKVGAYGTSYEGVTADWLGAARHPAVKAVLPTYSYCDVYLDVSHPGGILNDRFVKAWADLTALMDRNDTGFLGIVIAADPSGYVAQFAGLAYLLLQGVRPVADSVARLNEAVGQHADNTYVYDAIRGIEFRDDSFGALAVDDVSPLLGADGTERAAAIRRVVGWQDAGTVRGALRSFNALDVAFHVVVITPQSHSATYHVDPYDFADPVRLDMQQVIDEVWKAVPFFDRFLKHDAGGQPRPEVIYYTYVEDAWKQTAVWPPEGFETQRWYFAEGGRLSRAAPMAPAGQDLYKVDFDATTGRENRWFTGLGGVPIRYTDRAEQDELLLVYETAPLEQTVELTGHPVVSLQVRSTHTDGAFYVYLEDVGPEGEVVYLTEGQLRALHRKVSNESPPAAVFGPYHTFKRADAQPLLPGEVAEITFDLLPISTIIRCGHRIRVALGGHDRDTFARYPARGTPILAFERNAEQACWIDLPIRPREDLEPLPSEELIWPPVGGCPTAS